MEKERRIKLRKGEQRDLTLSVASKFGSLKKTATKLRVPYSTFRKYAQEVLFLPENLFNKFLSLSSINEGDLKFNYLSSNWGAVKGGVNGIKVLEKKYPKKIKEWRKKALENSRGSNIKEIKIPLLDERLAEFIGVYLGDGTLSKYFVKISGDYRYDYPYFLYIRNLVFNIFGIDSKIYRERRRNTMGLVICSKKLCAFLHEEFGLNYGHKIRNNTLIPEEILSNNKLSLACLRGLVDTDGSVSRRGKQFTITFTSHNKNLINQVRDISRANSLFTFISGDKRQIGTNNKDKIIGYFQKVGSSNLKHIIRFHLRFFKNETIYQRDLRKYYQKDFYRNMVLPFLMTRWSSG